MWISERGKEVGFAPLLKSSVACLKRHTWIPELLLFPLRRGFSGFNPQPGHVLQVTALHRVEGTQNNKLTYCCGFVLQRPKKIF